MTKSAHKMARSKNRHLKRAVKGAILAAVMLLLGTVFHHELWAKISEAGLAAGIGLMFE